MLTNIEQAMYCEKDRVRFISSVKESVRLRNIYVFNAFNEGARQKEIANACGLSESTVKHIIAEVKKELK